MFKKTNEKIIELTYSPAQQNPTQFRWHPFRRNVPCSGCRTRNESPYEIWPRSNPREGNRSIHGQIQRRMGEVAPTLGQLVLQSPCFSLARRLRSK